MEGFFEQFKSIQVQALKRILQSICSMVCLMLKSKIPWIFFVLFDHPEVNSV
jgi:hypothetical protein